MAGLDLPGLADFGIGGPPPIAPPPGAVPPLAAPGLPPGLVLPPGVAAAPILPPPPEAAPAPAVDAISGAAEASPAGPPPAAAPARPADPFAAAGADRDTAIAEQAAAVADLGGIRSRELANTGALYGESNTRMGELETEAEQQRKRDDAWLKELNGRYDAAIAADNEHTVDQKRSWKNKSTGDKVLAGIGMLMAGLGQALDSARLGGPKVGENPVIAMLMREAEQDVDLQLKEGEAKARRAGAAGQAVDRFAAIAKDRQTAFNLRMESETRKLQRSIAAAAAQYGSEEAVANAQKAIAELDEKAAGYRQGALDSAFARKMEEDRFGEQVTARKQSNALQRAGLAQSDRHFNLNLEERRKDRLLEADKLEKAGAVAAAQAMREAQAREDMLVIPGMVTEDGKPVLARSEKEAQAIRERKGSVDTAITLIDQTKRIIDKAGGSSKALKGKEYQQVTSNIAAIANTLRVAHQMGALDKGALEQMEKMMGGADPTSFLYDATPGLNQVRSQLIQTITDQARSQDPKTAMYTPPSSADVDQPGVNAIDAATNRLLTTTTPLEAGRAEQKTSAGRAVESALLVRGPGEELNSEKAAKRAEAAAADPSGADVRVLLSTIDKGGADGQRARENLVRVASAKPELSGAVLREVADTGNVELFDEIAKRTASAPGASSFAAQHRVTAQQVRVARIAAEAARGSAPAAQALITLTTSPDDAERKAAVEAIVELQSKVRQKAK